MSVPNVPIATRPQAAIVNINIRGQMDLNERGDGPRFTRVNFLAVSMSSSVVRVTVLFCTRCTAFTLVVFVIVFL